MLPYPAMRKFLSRAPKRAGDAGRSGPRRRRAVQLGVERVEQRALLSTVTGTNFTGLSLGSSGYIPPDTMGSVGDNNQIFEFLNGSNAVFDKSGTLLKRQSDVAFWNAAKPGSGDRGLSDPRVIFDPTTHRWFISMITTPGSGPNDILLAVSNTADATDGFKGYDIPNNGTSGFTSFGDYDTLGIDDHGVYVSTFGFPTAGSTSTTSLLFVKKADLIGEVTSPSFRLFVTSDPNVIDNYQPVQDLSGAATTSHNFYSAGRNYTEVATINGTDPATATLSTPAFVPNSLNTAALTKGQQPGGPNTIDTGGFRLSGHVIQALGSDWGIQEIEVGSHAAIRWIRFNPTTGAVLNTGQVSDPNRDYYYGSIAISPAGIVAIGFTGSSPSSSTGFSGFASTFYVSGTTDGKTLTLGTPTLTKDGAGRYSLDFGSGNVRWGDYSNTVVDPSDPTSFWTVQEFAATGNTWSTQITRINVQPQVAAVTSSIADGTYGVGAVIPIVITFDAPVTVNTAGGTPYLTLNLNGTAVNAPYTGGSGTTALTFTYTVAEGQTTAGALLDDTSSTALVLNGGTIVSASNGAPAVPTLPTPGSAGSLSASSKIIIDAVAPTVVSYSVLFGSQSYNLIGSSRFDLPWQITGISAVFSKPITAGDAASLTGVTTTGLSGLGTTTLTWTIAPLTIGTFATALTGTGADKLTDAFGNPVGGMAGFSDTFRVLYGDVNGDGVVDSSDMTTDFAATVTPYNIFADINGDGSVTLADVRIVRTRIGTHLP